MIQFGPNSVPCCREQREDRGPLDSIPLSRQPGQAEEETNNIPRAHHTLKYHKSFPLRPRVCARSVEKMNNLFFFAVQQKKKVFNKQKVLKRGIFNHQDVD